MKLLSGFLASIVTSFWVVHQRVESPRLPNPLEHKTNITMYYTAHNQSILENHIWVAAKSIEDNTNFLNISDITALPKSDFTIKFITVPETFHFTPRVIQLAKQWCPECLPQDVIVKWISQLSKG